MAIDLSLNVSVIISVIVMVSTTVTVFYKHRNETDNRLTRMQAQIDAIPPMIHDMKELADIITKMEIRMAVFEQKFVGMECQIKKVSDVLNEFKQLLDELRFKTERKKKTRLRALP